MQVKDDAYIYLVFFKIVSNANMRPPISKKCTNFTLVDYKPHPNIRIFPACKQCVGGSTDDRNKATLIDEKDTEKRHVMQIS